MSREDDSPTPADDAAAQGRTVAEGHEEAPAHSGSRWEPQTGTSEAAAPDQDGPDQDAPDQDAPDQDAPDQDGRTEQAVTAEGAPAAAAGTTWWHHEAPAPARPRRRGLRVAAGVGAAVVLAGGGFAVGHAVGDSGPDGGPDGGPGASVGRHHDHDGGLGGFGGRGQTAPGQGQTGQGQTTPSQGQTGQGQTGQNTSASTSAILGGLFT
ncbi:hypothetical protein [Actinomycetospora sp. TBRC 11914]|uniref:hypothetical protein n=1 Tax=Actinomycetospora sp. TBRC 11914 TaxID=2729387 RepID=UPI00145E683B|nr:hypothetical protein [Actinomycetospora sp. TBRC 11914]NMO88533.1 hypothetical protein [Actinomycetospora sp. TBRC 11914]